MKASSRYEWEEFAEDCYRAGKNVIENAEIWKQVVRDDDPKLIALFLLIRTLSNFSGAIVLAGMSMPVEARILTRCCFENLFTVVALAEQGAAFVRKMIQDYDADRKMRGEFLLKNASGPRDDDEQLKATLRSLQSRQRTLNPKNNAAAGPIHVGYAFYAQLSADAGHPTIAALYRYLERSQVGDKKVMKIHVDGVDAAEILETVNFACDALIGVAVYVNSILESPDNPELSRLLGQMTSRAAMEANFEQRAG